MAEGAAAQGSAGALCPCLSCWSSGAVPGQREPGDTLSFGFILALQNSELMRPVSQHLLVIFPALFSDHTLGSKGTLSSLSSIPFGNGAVASQRVTATEGSGWK